MNNTFTPEFLTNVSWKLVEHTNSFQCFFIVNLKWHLSITKGGTSNSGGDTFEVAVIHTQSKDIFTVHDFRTVREIEQMVESIQNQTF